MYREIKTKRTKIKAIASWLSRATFVHKDKSLPYDDFLDDAKNIYNNHVIGRVEANRAYGSYKITILIGQPDFEDTIGCKLPAAYLVFDTNDTGVVKISNIINAKPELDYLSHGGFRNRRIQSEYYTSMHPHVSSSGTPCLGSWSNSWAHALVNVNIPLLINVAKNFINTHTPDDAYWSFGEIWKAHNALRVELRDIISKDEFVETMLITKILNEDLLYNFPSVGVNLYNNNSEKIIELISNGVSFKDIFLAQYVLERKLSADVENNTHIQNIDLGLEHLRQNLAYFHEQFPRKDIFQYYSQYTLGKVAMSVLENDIDNFNHDGPDVYEARSILFGMGSQFRDKYLLAILDKADDLDVIFDMINVIKGETNLDSPLESFSAEDIDAILIETCESDSDYQEIIQSLYDFIYSNEILDAHPQNHLSHFYHFLCQAENELKTYQTRGIHFYNKVMDKTYKALNNQFLNFLKEKANDTSKEE